MERLDGGGAPPPPVWLQRLGGAAWLLVGIVLVLVGGVWVLGQTSTIVDPLILGAVVAAVGGQAVDWLARRRVPRPAGAAIVILCLIVLGAVIAALVLGGISSQSAEIGAATSGAVDKVQGWADDLGITSAQDAAKDIKKAVPEIGHALLTGVAGGIFGLTSLLVLLGFATFTSFFLLKDGPAMGRWIERHMGLQPVKARTVTGDIVHALRKYFVGLTIVSAFNATLVGLGALALGVPLPGTIAIVTFVAGYVPFLGAWTAGDLRRRARARLPGHHGRADHGPDRLPRQWAAAADRPAHRGRRRAGAERARRVRRDHRGRQPVRHGRTHPRRAAHLRRVHVQRDLAAMRAAGDLDAAPPGADAEPSLQPT